MFLARLNAAQRMFLAFAAGILVSTAGFAALSAYVLFFGLLRLRARNKQLLRLWLKLWGFLLCCYLTGGLLSPAGPLAGCIQGALKSLPLAVSILYVLLFTLGLRLSEIERGITDVVALVPFVPAGLIGFMGAMAFRFCLESLSLWTRHRDALGLRKSARFNPLYYGKCLILVPLVLLLRRSTQLSEAYGLRSVAERPRPAPESILRGRIFCLILSLLLLIRAAAWGCRLTF